MVNEIANDDRPPSPIPGSLRSRVFRASFWTLGGNFVKLPIQLLSSLITTRIFEPQIFGLVATSMAIYVMVCILADIGLGQAVFQSPNGEKPSFLNTAWTLRQLQGWLIWIMCAVFAGALHASNSWGWIPSNSVYANPILPAIIVVTAFSSVILSLQSMKAWVLNRTLNLRRITFIEIIAQIVSIVFIVSVGWLTRSIWAFIIGGLVASAMKTLLSHIWLRGAADRLAWDREALRELIHFGKWILLSSSITGLTTNGDRLMLAGLLNPSTLGFYSIASNIAATIEGIASPLMSNVMLPALSESARQNRDRLSKTYFRIRWILDTTMIGAAGFLFATGDWIINFLYDPRYAQAGWILQWLSFIPIFSRYNLAQSAYMAIGRPNYLFALNLINLASLFSMVPLLFYAFGIPGAIIGIAFYKAPSVLLMFWLNHRHRLNNFILEFTVLSAWPVGWLAGLALVAAFSHWLPFSSIADALHHKH